jgi:hypothetical protein
MEKSIRRDCTEQFLETSGAMSLGEGNRTRLDNSVYNIIPSFLFLNFLEIEEDSAIILFKHYKSGGKHG